MATPRHYPQNEFSPPENGRELTLNALPEARPESSDGFSFESRVENLPRDVGWMLFGVGFAGFIAPGIFGLPFMVAGGMILWPRTTTRVMQSLFDGASPQSRNSPGTKQIIRFLDDLERRYPHADQ